MMFLPLHGTFFFSRGVGAGSLGRGFSVPFFGVEGSVGSPFLVILGIRFLGLSATGTSGVEAA
jgi:hypothetical protein